MYLLSHLRGRKHQSALAAHTSANPTPSPSTTTTEGEGGGEEGIIVDATEEHQGSPRGELASEVQERLQAGKRKARKLRQRMNSR